MSEKQPETQAEGTEAEQKQPAPKPETSSTAKAETEGERRFTQAELDEKIERRLSKERRKMEREKEELQEKLEAAKVPEVKPKEPEAKKETGDDRQETDQELKERLSKLEQENAEQRATNLFNEVIADSGLRPTKGQRKRLRSLFDPKDPDDIVEVAKEFNIPSADDESKEGVKAEQKTEEQQEEPKGEGPAHLYRDPGGPRSADDHNEVNAIKWSPEQIQRMRSDGTLLEKARQFRSTLRGGDGGLFRKKVPKVT